MVRPASEAAESWQRQWIANCPVGQEALIPGVGLERFLIAATPPDVDSAPLSEHFPARRGE
jgi:hypothetical protein